MKFIILVLALATLAAADYTLQSAYNEVITNKHHWHGMPDDGKFLKFTDLQCVQDKLGVNSDKGAQPAKLSHVLLSVVIASFNCLGDNEGAYFEEDFNDWLHKYRHIGYDKYLGCFKKALIPIDPKAKVLIGFDPASVTNSDEECQKILTEVMAEYYRIHSTFEAHSEGSNFIECNPLIKANPDYYKGMLLKYVILANDGDVTPEFLTHKKALFKADYDFVKKQMNDCYEHLQD